MLRMEIDKMKSYSQVDDADKGIDNSIILITQLLVDCVLPPLECDYKDNTFLRDHVESKNIPSCMITVFLLWFYNHSSLHSFIPHHYQRLSFLVLMVVYQ